MATMKMKATAATTMPAIAPLDRPLPLVVCAGVEVGDGDELVVAIVALVVVVPVFAGAEVLLVDVI